MTAGGRGMVMVWAAAWIIFALCACALVLDLGRLLAVREQAQTAVDAGSLAGSMQGIRHVEVRVPDRWKRVCSVCCCGIDTCSPCCCRCETYDLPDKLVRGTRKYVWDEKGWYREAGCGSCGGCCYVHCGSPKVKKQWVEFPGSAESVARDVVALNLPAEMTPGEGGGVYDIEVDPHEGAWGVPNPKNDPLAPSVVVKLKGWVRSLLSGGIFGERDLDVRSCGQSGTFFFLLSREGEQTEKTNPKPQPGCP